MSIAVLAPVTTPAKKVTPLSGDEVNFIAQHKESVQADAQSIIRRMGRVKCGGSLELLITPHDPVVRDGIAAKTQVNLSSMSCMEVRLLRKMFNREIASVSYIEVRSSPETKKVWIQERNRFEQAFMLRFKFTKTCSETHD